jgi:uncharacterized protein
VDLPPPTCTLLKECGVYVVVEHNGDVYSCDFFVEPEWKLGNIMEKKIVDMLNSQKQRTFGRMKSRYPDVCMECEWLRYCRGGCTKDRIRDPRDKGWNHFCRAYKMFFEHADPTLKALAENWKAEQAVGRMVDEERSSKHRHHDDTVGRNDPCPCGSGLKFKKCCGQG